MSEAASAPDLESLLATIRACRICRDHPTGPPLPHEPRPVVRVSPSARLLIAGQAPGTRVHASGLPFDDPSGDRLRSWLGLDRARFYDCERVAFVPMGFCFPGLSLRGADLPPRRECAPAWRRRLLGQLPAIALILLIGRHAQRWHLGEAAAATLSATVREWRRIYDADTAVRTFVLPHPSWRNSRWLELNPWFDAEVLPVLRADVARVLRT